jgi:ubiquitin C-terminal hydrolase
VLDIFGGIIRTEFHVEGSREHTVRFETSFVLSLDIIKDECTIEDCLDRFFEKQRVEGYQLNGKTVRAHHTLMFEKLPNILMVNLKRFVYRDGMIKKKEHVYFDDVLTIEDRHVSPCLQLGIFKRSSEVKAR